MIPSSARLLLDAIRPKCWKLCYFISSPLLPSISAANWSAESVAKLI